MSAHRKPPLPPHFDCTPVGTCRWCNQAIGLTRTGKESRARWHPACVKEYQLMFWPSEARKVVWKRDKGVCRSCGTQCERRNHGWHLDHIQPLIEAQGDLTFWQLPNLQTLCVPCHKAKTALEAGARAEKRRAEKK
jgi:5-methylcytosine-specific restriction endonuclease McrA